jgi:FkbM family methyltransferase
MAQAKFEFRVRKVTDFSALEIGEQLRRLIQNEGGFYVEVGANDGRSSSNTFWLERELRWKGILIEPVLHKYFEIKLSRDHRKNTFIYGACVSEDFKGDNLKFFYSNLMTAPDYGEGELFAKKGESFLSDGEEVLPFWAPAFTLRKVLSDHGTSHIDFLSIDVEGGEIEVLKGFPWELVSVDLILIETSQDSIACRFLEEKGYIRIVDLVDNHFYVLSKIET